MLYVHADQYSQKNLGPETCCFWFKCECTQATLNLNVTKHTNKEAVLSKLFQLRILPSKNKQLNKYSQCSF